MSDIRYNQWLHNSGTGGVSQDAGGNIGIGTTAPLIPVGAGNTTILNVGVVTANYIYGTVQGAIEGTLDDWIVHAGDTDTKFGFPANDTFQVHAGGTERLHIASNGNVVINSTTSGEAKLDVHGGVAISSNSVAVSPSGYDLKIRSNTSKLGIHCDSGSGTPILEFGTGGSTGCFITNLDNTPMRFGTQNTERLRIQGTGGVGLSTTLIRNQYFMNIAAPSQAFSGSTNLTDGGGIMFQHTDTLASTGRTYPGIFWAGNTASLGRARAGILGVTASNNDATDIVFLTRYAADGTAFYPTDERLRIKSNGFVGIGTNNPARKLHVEDDNSEIALYQSRRAAGSYVNYKVGANGAELGMIGSGAAILSGGADAGDFGIRSAGDLCFSSGGHAEKVRIDPSGRVLIGATSSSSPAKLAVNGGISNAEAFFELNRTDDPANSQNIGIIEFCQGNSASRLAARIITRRDGGVWGAASLPTRFEFHTCVSGSNSASEKVRITSAGQLQINHGNAAKMSFYHDAAGSLNHITSNNGNEIKVSSGNGNSNGIEFWDYTGTNKRCQIDAEGIKFNTDTAAANGLDDYEEGSFNVTLVGQYGGNANYSYRQGYYTRVGRMVHVVGDVRFNGSWSGSSGNVYVQLPFGTSYASGGTVGNGTVAEWNLNNSNWDWIGITLDNNSANAKFTSHSGSNNNTSYLQTGELGNGRWLKFGFTYITA